MNTILTDDELPPMPDGTHPQSLLGQMLLKYARAIEAAVLAKLAQQADRQRVPEDWKTVQAALRFYADASDYKAPFTGGMGKLWFDCGTVARSALDRIDAMLAAAPEAPAQGIDKETQTMKLLALVDDLIERDPDKAERFIESALARNALRKRLMEKKAATEAPAQASAVDERAAPEVTEFNVGRWCLSEDDCIEQGIDFAAYERGVADAATTFGRNRARVANGIGGEGKR